MTETIPLINVIELATTITDDEAGFGALETHEGIMPLKAMDVKSKITGLTYTLTLTQTFVNTFDTNLEATYIFPLPCRAVVSKFRFKVADRVIDGVLKERKEARTEYNKAIKDGHRAALAEEDRPSVFSMKVGNIMPGEMVQVELELSGQLSYMDGEVEFRFPFVVAPRYIPGRPIYGESVGDGVAIDTDQVSDASRISPPVLLPGFPNPIDLSLEVTIDGGALPINKLRSSLHAVSKKEIENSGMKVTLYPGERLNRDFILRFFVADDNIESNLAVFPDEDKIQGTFQLTLVPPANLAKATPRRDVVFLLDRSGSMSGWKMVCARRALGRMVDTLTERDRFAVLGFDNVIELAPGHEEGKLCQATDRNRFRTVEWLGRINARGGTEMAQPLAAGTNILKRTEEGVERILVLVTDGQIGNEDEILRRLGRDIEKIRIFTLGIDRAVNQGFLKRLASAGGGYCELVESEDRLDEVMDRTHRRIATPVLTDLSIKMHGATLDPDSISPARVPDVFAGSPVLISGRYMSKDGDISIKVAAKKDGSAWSVQAIGNEISDDALRKLWAREHIRDLEDLAAGGRGYGDIEKRITEISLRFGVLCRYTAFVAVDRSEKIDLDGKSHQVTQAVESPEGWDMLQEAGSVFDVLECLEMDDMPQSVHMSTESRVSNPLSFHNGNGISRKEKSKSPAGSFGSVFSRLLSFRKEHRDEEPTVPIEINKEKKIQSLDEAIESATEILKDLRDALGQGTHSLAQAMFDRRKKIALLVEFLDEFGYSEDIVKMLKEIAETLNSETVPDSPTTARLWERLEKALKDLIEA
jgi:Ca-activated chloride channel family protein